jgi:hypothetical protein
VSDKAVILPAALRAPKGTPQTDRCVSHSRLCRGSHRIVTALAAVSTIAFRHSHDMPVSFDPHLLRSFRATFIRGYVYSLVTFILLLRLFAGHVHSLAAFIRLPRSFSCHLHSLTMFRLPR